MMLIVAILTLLAAVRLRRRPATAAAGQVDSEGAVS
jgi:hypothetical protein